jgi:hypothetical protein
MPQRITFPIDPDGLALKKSVKKSVSVHFSLQK